jgi:hypothetical protein
LGGISYIAHEYFSEWEATQSSTYRELLGVIRCLQSLIEICKGKLVVVQIDAMNLLGIVNRGSSRLAFNTLARELFGSAFHTKSSCPLNGYLERATLSQMISSSG